MKTKSGFIFKADKKVLNNMELIDLIADMEDKPQNLGKLLGLILGEEDKTRLYNHVRDADGRVPVDAVTAELGDIFNLLGSTAKK